MAYGIQVNNSSGIAQFNSTNRLTRFIGFYSYGAFTFPSTANITIPGIVDDGTWACFANATGVGVTINSGSITVANGYGTSPSGTVSVFRY